MVLFVWADLDKFAIGDMCHYRAITEALCTIGSYFSNVWIRFPFRSLHRFPPNGSCFLTQKRYEC